MGEWWALSGVIAGLMKIEQQKAVVWEHEIWRITTGDDLFQSNGLTFRPLTILKQLWMAEDLTVKIWIFTKK